MNSRAIPRTAVGGYLKLVRLPFDAVIGLLPSNGKGAAPAAKLAFDRAEASARAVAARILADPVLREDAERRRAAAGERSRALRLRGRAQSTTEDADARLTRREEQAARRRKQANQRARAQRNQAADKRKEKAARAAATEKRRRTATRKAKARSDRAVDELARESRLDVLDTKADAMRETEEALTASDEARRLSDAVTRTKAARKRG